MVLKDLEWVGFALEIIVVTVRNDETSFFLYAFLLISLAR